MSNKVKDIDIRNRTYCFFNDIFIIKRFDASNVIIDENSYKNNLFYYTGYATIKDSKYIKIYSVKSFVPGFQQSV